MRLNVWLLTICGIQRHHSQTLLPDYSVFFCTIIAVFNRGFSKRLRLFSPIFLPSWLQWRMKFSSSDSVLSFSGMGRFRIIFMTSWFTAYGLSDRGRSFRNSEPLKHCFTWWTVILLTFSCFKISGFLKPTCKKVNISILLASIRRYLTFGRFPQLYIVSVAQW